MTVSTDIAKRVYDHTFKLDPIVRSLLDTDFYKLLMLQMIWGLYGDVRATFSLINRTARVRVADEVDERELRDQLDHARTLRFTKKEMIWLAGKIFMAAPISSTPNFWPGSRISSCPSTSCGATTANMSCISTGPGPTPPCGKSPLSPSSTNCARARRSGIRPLHPRRAVCARQGQAVEQGGAAAPIAGFAHLGFRHPPPPWLPVAALVRGGPQGGLGDALIGTSNVLLAMDNDLEAIGTNAHELPMVLAAMARDDDELRRAPYQVLRDWQRYYAGNLLVVLPDTFGTAAFLRDAPDWVADWTGFRPDSAPPIAGGEEIIAWWNRQGRDPARKTSGILRRARRRYHRGGVSAFRRPRPHELRLGHQPHQRFRGLCPATQ